MMCRHWRMSAWQRDRATLRRRVAGSILSWAPHVALIALVVGATLGLRVPSLAAQGAVPFDPDVGDGTSRSLVALLVPLSGEYAHLGTRTVRTVMMAAEPYDQLHVEVYDSASGPVEAFQRARDDGAIALLGPIGLSEAREVAALAADADVPVFLLSGVHGIELAGETVFRLRTSPHDQARAIAGVSVISEHANTFTIVAPDDSYGTEATLAFVSQASAAGGVVHRVITYDSERPDFGAAAEEAVGRRTRRLSVPGDPWRTPPRSRVVLERGDQRQSAAIFVPDYDEYVADLLPFLQFQELITDRLDTSAKLLGLAGWTGIGIELVGDLAVGAWVTQVYSVEDPSDVSESFTHEYEIRFRESPTELDAQVYDAATFVMSALTRWGEGPYDEVDVLDAIDAVDSFAGVCGTMWMDADGGVVRDIGLWEVDASGELFPIGVIHPPSTSRRGR